MDDEGQRSKAVDEICRYLEECHPEKSTTDSVTLKEKGTNLRLEVVAFESGTQIVKKRFATGSTVVHFFTKFLWEKAKAKPHNNPGNLVFLVPCEGLRALSVVSRNASPVHVAVDVPRRELSYLCDKLWQQ